MKTPNPKTSDAHRPSLLTRIWNWLCRRNSPNEAITHPNQRQVPPICYDME